MALYIFFFIKLQLNVNLVGVKINSTILMLDDNNVASFPWSFFYESSNCIDHNRILWRKGVCYIFIHKKFKDFSLLKNIKTYYVYVIRFCNAVYDLI